MPKPQSASYEYTKTFHAVMDAYEDARTMSTSISSEGVYRGLSNDAGKNDSGMCQRVVRPSVSDFICDVEIAARRVLDPVEMAFFKAIYIEFATVSPYVKDTDAYRYTNANVRRKVGRAFVSLRIHPLSTYFSAKDLR